MTIIYASVSGRSHDLYVQFYRLLVPLATFTETCTLVNVSLKRRLFTSDKSQRVGMTCACGWGTTSAILRASEDIQD